MLFQTMTFHGYGLPRSALQSIGMAILLTACVKELHELLAITHETIQEQYHPKNYTELIENIRTELKSLVKGEK